MQVKPYLIQITVKRDKDIPFNEHPFNIPAISKLDVLSFHQDVTFIIGENGTGKSTIMEAIALALGFGPEGGTKNVQLQTADTVSRLHEYIRPIRSFSKPTDNYFLRAESFYNVATYMDEVGYLEGYGGQSLHQISHGEAFMATLTNKLRGHGLYILDEPEAALSPTRQMAALAAIHRLVEDESQFIIATHSPILLSYPKSKIISLDNNEIKEIKYEDTEHYIITRSFLNNPSKMLKTLLNNE